MFVRRNYYDTQDPFIQIFDKALKQIAKNYNSIVTYIIEENCLYIFYDEQT